MCKLWMSLSTECFWTDFEKERDKAEAWLNKNNQEMEQQHIPPRKQVDELSLRISELIWEWNVALSEIASYVFIELKCAK